VLLRSDPILEEVLRANAAAGMPAQDVAPNQGKLLYLLALARGAQRILEIGTLGGYSTIWLARALAPGGRLVTLESNPNWASVAALNIARAGLADRVDILVGDATGLLQQLDAESEPFDLIFIDADKPNNPAYLTGSLRLSKKGTLIIGDNVVREGAVVSVNADPSAAGVRTFLEMMGDEPRLSATAVQTVGAKGYDGFSLAVVITD